MSGHVAETYEAFVQLWPRWTAIAEAGGVQTPYQSFAWLDQWLRHRGRGVEPFALVVQDGETIAPFGRAHVAGVRVLRLLGTGDSDYLGLVTASPADEAWDNVAQELAQRRNSWDLLHLHSVRDREAIIAALKRHIGFGGLERPYETCPWVATDRSWEDLLASRGKGLRPKIRRWARLVEARGRVSLELMKSPVPEKVINEMTAVERASWKWESGEAALRPGPRRDFLEAVLRDPRMDFHLWLLRVSARLVAFTLDLVAQDRWYSYLSTFRQDYSHAGSYLLARELEEACASECVCVDLLRGPQAFKYAWTDLTNTVYEIVYPSDVRGQAAALVYAARWHAAKSPMLQTVRARLMKVGDRR